MKVIVRVRLKKSILDPQGKAVHKALHNLGFSEIQDVRIGKLIELEISKGKSKEEIHIMVQEAGRKLLSNPLIEELEIEYLGE